MPCAKKVSDESNAAPPPVLLLSIAKVMSSGSSGLKLYAVWHDIRGLAPILFSLIVEGLKNGACFSFHPWTITTQSFWNFQARVHSDLNKIKKENYIHCA